MPKTRAKPTPKPVGGVTKIQAMPEGRRRRGSWLKTIGLQAWDELFDGNAYRVELPKVDEQEGSLQDFIDAARQALRHRNGVRGESKALIAHRETDRVVLVQVVDE